MEQLIWYTMPGGLASAAFLLTHMAQVSTSQVVGAVAVSPIVGFVLHQLARVIFEFFYGYNSGRRKVIARLIDQIQEGEEDKTALKRRAFLTWELTFYSGAIPESYREHDRGSWHYIMAFWSSSFAAVIGIAVVAFASCPAKEVCAWSFLYAFLAFVFASKAALTARSISEQEVAVLTKYFKAFNETAQQLKDAPGARIRDEKARA